MFWIVNTFKYQMKDTLFMFLDTAEQIPGPDGFSENVRSL